MKRTALGKAAISSLLVATTMVGCTGQAFRPRSSVAVVGTDGAKLAAKAEKALADRAFADALQAAEAAVAATPDNAAYRQILGRAYAANGRFLSAETALTDAMTLGNSDARTIVTLALVQVGLGKGEAARSLLAAHADTVPAADYGLAVAMAGDPLEGVRVLSQAIHDPSATARTRQNLAYAYALAGRWKDARMMAGEDLAPLEATQRIAQWAMMAEPSMGAQRVASLMGVAPDMNDAGQPVALALAPAAREAAPVALADAGTQPPPSVEGAPIVEAPAAVAVASAEPQLFAPIIRAPAIAARAAAPAATVRKVAFLQPVEKGASNWVVQVGAYDSAAVAREKWQRMATINDRLAAFPVLTSTATVKGRAFHRLALSGFGKRTDAMALCQSIRAQRGQCFVREASPDATPQRWALALRGRQFASR
ncbi:MAG: SPOR domain-containing protein [Sphingobium sp.]|nr:SPOR domain-containing protein [Sphingobium sp.]